MAQLLIEIPDEYLPGIEAARHSSNSSCSNAAEFASHIAVEAAKSWCIQYKVGPYWVEPKPEFNPDGSPYVVEDLSINNSTSDETMNSENLMNTTSDETLSSENLIETP